MYESEKIIIPETTTVIEENAFKNCPLLTIYTPKGSYAEKFAKSHQIPVQYIDDGINDTKLTLQVAERKKDEVTLKWEASQLYFVDGYEIERKNLRGEYIHCSTIKSNDINTKILMQAGIPCIMEKYYFQDQSIFYR